MKVTYELDSSDLKAAIEAWMASQGTPVSDADTFTIGADGTVTIVVVASVPPVVVPPIAPPIVVTPPVTPGHTITVNPPFSVTGTATEFGYNDPADNGIGFFTDPATNQPYQTNNDVLRGVSLPREVLLSTFLKIDSWKTDGIDSAWSKNADVLRQWVDGNNPVVSIDSGGKSAHGLPIVDAGPTSGTGNAIDLTGKMAEELGTQGKAQATYMILVDGKPVEILGWDFTKNRVG